jgi:putative metalloprotease
MRHFHLLATTAAVLALSGCANLDTASLLGAGTTALQAMSLTDGQVATMSEESCAAMDQKSTIAPANNKYTQRLNQAVKAMPTSVGGKPANYKVYITNDVNAWAMANGCIRVYSGLMDLMNDDELRGVIGHEIGHVALGHSKSRMQVAYGASAARQLAAASGNSIAVALSQSQAGDLAEKFINAQYSQANESAADDYSFDLLKQRGLPRTGLVTGFQKLAKISGNQGSSLMSSHPPSSERAAHMQQRLDREK